MTESLRDQQRRVATDRIIQAAAEELVQVGLANLSVPAVAERAGVSLRTVYNHFENKEILLDSLIDASDALLESLGAIDVETDPQKLPDAIRHNWPLFGQLGVIGQASTIVSIDRAASVGQIGPTARNSQLTAALRSALHDLDASLDEGELEATMAILRLLLSFGSWNRLVNEFGVDPTNAAEASAWAFATLRDALARGEGPFPKT
ncbi:MAG: TetR/AcrR family transcriptional regulator [Chloroflexi bacterium]|nr:TetR/AcrR family transcriptional regulator [Chloroflexota bacterium]MDA1147122.1 TetR/AcrR family transcriptional regulator [Chloroflexota bacterium]